MRLIICAGGTGGGVYPALAIHEAFARLQGESSEKSGAPKAALQTLWIGGEGGMENRLVERSGIPFKAIPAAGVHGVGLKSLPRNLSRLGKGYLASRRIVREYHPDVMLFTGGYVAVPMALAGSGVPKLLFVPDIEPGLALKTLARFADCITVSTEESRGYFSKSKRVIVTGYPTRRELSTWNRKAAQRALGLNEKKPVLLVLGGSKGARSINNAIGSNLAALLEMAQVVHITGELDWHAVQGTSQILPAELSTRYHIHPYLHEQMGAALAAADLVVSRAGASALGEYPLFNVPAILVPYPHAWRYQKVNAQYLAGNGAAIVLDDADLQEKLVPLVRDLLGNSGKLQSMRSAMNSLNHPHAAEEIGHALMGLAGERR